MTPWHFCFYQLSLILDIFLCSSKINVQPLTPPPPPLFSFPVLSPFRTFLFYLTEEINWRILSPSKIIVKMQKLRKLGGHCNFVFHIPKYSFRCSTCVHTRSPACVVTELGFFIFSSQNSTNLKIEEIRLTNFKSQ